MFDGSPVWSYMLESECNIRKRPNMFSPTPSGAVRTPQCTKSSTSEK